MHHIRTRNVPRAYQQVMELIHLVGAQEDSRNGPVITIQSPLVLTITHPGERLLLNPARDANPFFHLMEAIWMFAGSNEVEWLLQFNKRYIDYAEPHGIVHGAYGHRWRNHFRIDQIHDTIDVLGFDPNTRQAVIGMWDPEVDGPQFARKDRPCNTHIYFRTVGGRLNMTVCNRSNDVVWGMLGANAVHMTMLQELISCATGIPMGDYIVFTNNAHVYPEMPRYDQIMTDLWHHDIYPMVSGYPLLSPVHHSMWPQFLADCHDFIEDRDDILDTPFMNEIALPMKRAYLTRKTGGTGKTYIDEMPDSDWKIACTLWMGRRDG